MPDYALSSHVAPLGVAMYTGSDLPAKYRSGAFVGEHGSWDRTPLNGYKVVFVPFSDGKAERPGARCRYRIPRYRQSRPRKASRLAVDRSGGLLIADDVGNTVWRCHPFTRVRCRR